MRRGELNEWFESEVRRSDFRVRRIPFAASRDWFFDDGSFRHRTGRFFSVTGAGWAGRETVLIDQPEVGRLGIIVKADEPRQLLVHAKIEPGNVGICQLAPTCQATRSNQEQIHGGEVPPFTEPFDEAQPICSLQSEQGTRFLQKKNSNEVLEVEGLDVSDTPSHRWLPVQSVAGLLEEDFIVNTDLRSALVSAPWTLLATEPFSGAPRQVRASYSGEHEVVSLTEVTDSISQARSGVPEPDRIALHELRDWSITDDAIVNDSEAYRVVHIETRCATREVPTWDQPIIEGIRSGREVLPSHVVGDALVFGFQMQENPALPKQCELGTWTSFPGDAWLSVWQSDEGGRFLNHRCVYSIVRTQTLDKRAVWLNLQQIQELLVRGLYFTNEARSALSLLLRFL